MKRTRFRLPRWPRWLTDMFDLERFWSAQAIHQLGELDERDKRIATLTEALAPFAALPTDFARIDDQPVFTVLGGPFGETPQAQTWTGNRSIYVRDIRRAKAALANDIKAEDGATGA